MSEAKELIDPEELRKRKEQKEKLNSSKWWKHRSTWMGVALIFSGILLILAFTVATPAIEILLVVFGVLVILPKVMATFIAIYDANFWLITYDNWPSHFINWAKNNDEQIIIACLGTGLSFLGIALFIGFAPALFPVLTAACGCSVFVYALYLAGYGPVTIADAINRLLDRHRAEKNLQALEDADIGTRDSLLEKKSDNRDHSYDNYVTVKDRSELDGESETKGKMNTVIEPTTKNNI